MENYTDEEVEKIKRQAWKQKTKLAKIIVNLFVIGVSTITSLAYYNYSQFDGNINNFSFWLRLGVSIFLMFYIERNIFSGAGKILFKHFEDLQAKIDHLIVLEVLNKNVKDKISNDRSDEKN